MDTDPAQEHPLAHDPASAEALAPQAAVPAPTQALLAEPDALAVMGCAQEQGPIVCEEIREGKVDEAERLEVIEQKSEGLRNQGIVIDLEEENHQGEIGAIEQGKQDGLIQGQAQQNNEALPQAPALTEQGEILEEPPLDAPVITVIIDQENHPCPIGALPSIAESPNQSKQQDEPVPQSNVAAQQAHAPKAIETQQEPQEPCPADQDNPRVGLVQGQTQVQNNENNEMVAEEPVPPREDTPVFRNSQQNSPAPAQLQLENSKEVEVVVVGQVVLDSRQEADQTVHATSMDIEEPAVVQECTSKPNPVPEINQSEENHDEIDQPEKNQQPIERSEEAVMQSIVPSLKIRTQQPVFEDGPRENTQLQIEAPAINSQLQEVAHTEERPQSQEPEIPLEAPEASQIDPQQGNQQIPQQSLIPVEQDIVQEIQENPNISFSEAPVVENTHNQLPICHDVVHQVEPSMPVNNQQATANPSEDALLQMVDIDEIKKMLLPSLSEEHAQLVMNLPDQEIRRLFLQITAQEASAAQSNPPPHPPTAPTAPSPPASVQANQQPPLPELEIAEIAEPQVATFQRAHLSSPNGKESHQKPEGTTKKVTFIDHRRAEREQEQAKQANEPQAVSSAAKTGKRVIRQRKRIITTVYQQIEYFDDDEDIGDGMSKHITLDNGEGRRRKPQASKSKTQGILHQINALVKCLDLSSLNTTGPQK